MAKIGTKRIAPSAPGRRAAGSRSIRIYDCTLREGGQASHITLSLRDKLRILQLIDEIGFAYTEGGWPASNASDEQFLAEIRTVPLRRTKIVAFGRTRLANVDVEHDVNLNNLIRTGLECGHIFGKGWDFHVIHVLRTSLDQNLDAIHESVRYLKRHMGEVSFGFEHFFDAFKANPGYSHRVIEAAIAAGVDWIDLADTNGGCFPDEIGRMVGEVVARYPIPFAVHCHDDTGCAVANTIAAVNAGVTIVEGTVNGISERCGMADLCTVIPNLQLKLGYECIPEASMSKLTGFARAVADIVHMEAPALRPYVGSLAFTHKGGVHVDAFLKNPRTYEHIDPALVGNRSDVVVSAVSGKSNLEFFLRKHRLTGFLDHTAIAGLLATVKALELSGSDFNAAEESLLLLILRETGRFTEHVELVQTALRFVDGTRVPSGSPSDAEVSTAPEEMVATERIEFSSVIRFGRGASVEREAFEFVAEGQEASLPGVVRRLIEHLARHFPSLGSLELVDHKLRAIDDQGQPCSRVILDFMDGAETVRVLGLGRNVVSATLSAAVDAVEFKLNMEALRREPAASERA